MTLQMKEAASLPVGMPHQGPGRLVAFGPAIGPSTAIEGWRLVAGTMAAQTMEVKGWVGGTPGVHGEIGTHMVVG